MILSIISAIGSGHEIGRKNELLWNLPRDMRHFKEITEGHPVIMGQKTFESIGHPLPKRRNIVLTKDEAFNAKDVETVYSVDELVNLLERTEPDNECFIIGGGQIYRLFIDQADRLYITHVNETFPDADTFFPPIDQEDTWKKIKSEKFQADPLNKYDLEFALYERK